MNELLYVKISTEQHNQNSRLPSYYNKEWPIAQRKLHISTAYLLSILRFSTFPFFSSRNIFHPSYAMRQNHAVKRKIYIKKDTSPRLASFYQTDH